VLDGAQQSDVCVVGLGGSGLACIHSLLDAGHRVIGIDAIDVAAGAAGRNGGFLLGGLAMFHHDAVARLGEHAASAIYRETLAQIDRMARETPSAVRRTGSLRIATSDDEARDCDRQLEAMCRSGLPVERYAGEQGSGLLFPSDASFDPMLRCRTLARAAIERGARLFVGSRVTAIDRCEAITDRGRVRAASIVVAVDGSIETILPELAHRVRSARLQMLATAPDDGVHWPQPVYARWGLDYWQQLGDKRVVLGGFRDVGGEGEWTTSATPTEPVQAAMDSLLRELGVRAPVTHRWAATVAYTQSGLPIIEEVRPNVWAIGAYSGTGNVIGAICGRAVAECITQGRSALADLFKA
jgi:glycine/D-amino acid oxidase-like deaminating enzyme